MEKYPPYPRGFSQFIGADIIDDLAIAFAYTRIDDFPDDVLLGLLSYKLNISMRNEGNMYGERDYEKYNPDKRPAMVASEEYFKT